MSQDAVLTDVLDVITRLARGELDARVQLPEVLEDDEITAIAVGMNMLAEELEHLRGGLETAVAKRTEELRATQDQLTYDASHDHLTGLANRRLLHQRIDHQLVRGAESSALLLLDLDGFKDVNDSFGHGIGDAVLVEVGRRLRQCLRPTDTVARLGGDEFAALLQGVTDDGLEVVAARVLEAFQKPIEVEGFSTAVTASVGLVPMRHAVMADDLLRLADLAMYRAKADGKNRARVYTEQIEEQARQRREIEQGIRSALDACIVAVVYQPLVDARTQRLVGVEGLSRWPHTGGTMYAPSLFIPVAEEAGMIQEWGAAVLRQVCRDATRWAEQTGLVLRFSVNVSGDQLADPGFADLVLLTLSANGATPAMLALEVTESVIMDHQLGVAALGRLREAGISIAIDDFGTGFSSLSSLRRLPVDTLKVDRSFVSGLGDDDDDSTIVRAVLGLARGLHLPVVAEGVETVRQQDELVLLGCDVLQGYLYGRPMPYDDLRRWADDRVPAATGAP